MSRDVMTCSLPRDVKDRTDDKHQRLHEILDIICENVAFEWKAFAGELEVSAREISEIESSFVDTHTQCLQVIDRWRQANSRAKLRDLVGALRKCRLGRVADLVTKLSHSNLSVDEILTPHLEREAKMRECLYLVADSVSRDWRVLAQKLGLTRAEVAQVAAPCEARSREKCMLALYRWRTMAPLADYKISTIIQALRAGSMHQMAQALTTYANTGQDTWTKYSRKKGEVCIRVLVDDLILATEWSGQTETTSLPIDTVSCISDVNTVSTHRSDASSISRIKLSLGHEALQNYALTKCFYRLLDDLDLQDRHGVHAINKYFLDLHNDLHLSHVSRPRFFLVVQAATKDGVSALWSAYSNGTLSEEVSRLLAKPEILEELNIAKMSLTLEIDEQNVSHCLSELL